MLNNEKGYGLVLTLLVITVLSVVGLAVVAATIQGTFRTTVREVDVNISAEAEAAMDEVVGDLRTALREQSTQYMISITKDANGQIDSLFDTHLKDLAQKIVVDDYKKKDFLEDVTIEDVTTSELNASTLSNHFTRIYNITIVTKAPDDKKVSKLERTYTKRVIISPTPSFLQYALGSAESLILNGSPTITGNVFANELVIHKEANYTPTNGNGQQRVDTPFPQITGSLYSQNKNLFADKEPREAFFYKEKVPALKNDSNFIDFKFDEAMLEEERRIFSSENLQFTESSSVTAVLNKAILQAADKGTMIAEDVLNSIFNSLKLPDITSSLLTKNGSILTVPSLYEVLSLGDDLVFSQSTQVANISDSTLSSIVVKGDLVLSNISNLTITDKLFVDGNVTITNLKGANITLPKIISTGDITIVNQDGTVTLTDSLLTSGSLLIDTNDDISLDHPLFVGNNLTLKPLNSTFELTKNIVVKNNLTITGNTDVSTDEKEIGMFDSIVYTGGEVKITNVSIEGFNYSNEGKKGMLILLAKGPINLNRINEFTTFNDEEEQRVNFKNLKDQQQDVFSLLQGFFYTESSAELYGVGSLFAIDGGIFSQGPLTVNAVRGNVETEKDIDRSSTSQVGKYSRFNVLYDRSVLLTKLESLPLVDTLQVIPEATIQPRN
ncbi:hypothetical protein P5663_05830 [Priestia flexa]|uniref:hypothetical protein n=1 Tax=Priestia flexa TaxID=86664 RepID=UPI00240D8EFB|nr:hypothetical protein [Priestia flexa]WEZ09375.1 hypothetical protein P5663_05830 [Priestia flexa]